MPSVEFNKDELVELFLQYIGWDERKGSIQKLKGFDWNPFDDDGDEYEGVWAEMKHNVDLIFDVVKDLVIVAERIVVGGASLTSPQKKDVVVAALDRAIRLPFFLEPFDGPVLGLVVDFAVKFLNKVDWGIAESMEPVVVERNGDGKLAWTEVG